MKNFANNNSNNDQTPYDNIPVGLFRVSAEGNFIFVNNFLVKMLGFESKAEFLKIRMKDIWADLSQRNSFWDTIVAQKSTVLENFEIKVLKKDKTVKNILANMKISWNEQGAVSYFEGYCFDTTDWERLKDQLIEGRKKYFNFYDKSVDGIVLVDKNWKVLEANEAYCQMVGYSLEELRQMENIYEITPKKWEKIQRQAILNRNFLETGHGGIFEKEYIRKDGTIFPIEMQGHLVRDKNGEVDYVWAVIRDTTEREKAKKKILEHEKQLLSIFDGMGELIYVSDPNTYEILFMNKICRKNLGDNIGQKCYKVFQGFDAPCSFCTNKMIFGENLGKTHIWEFQNIKDKNWYRCIDRAIEWPSRGMVRYEMAINITTQKELEKNLIASRKNYQLIADNVTDLITIITFEENPKFVYLSPSHEKVLGYHPLELIQKSIFEVVHPQDKEKITSIIQEYIKILPALTAEKISQIDFSDIIEFRVKTKHGKTIYLETAINLVEWGLILLASRDITERKKAEKEKKKLQTQLFQSQKLKSIGTMASGISHNFNNILASIRGYAEMALDDAPADSRMHSDLKKAIDGIDAAKQLIQKILIFAHERPSEIKRIDVASTVNDSLEMFKIASKDAIIKSSIQGNCGYILADPIEVQQVVLNLCRNSYQALRDTEKDFIEVSLSAIEVKSNLASKHIHLDTGEYILLSIKDTGEGIDEQVKNRIFEPFFTTKPIGEGTGLGLSMVHGIVRGYGGEIIVESKKGEGTTFFIYFPKA